ncbi:MAG: hypothetical protein JO253_03040 [Alphaproteobacteria bacterium]|nr:hypothetical protein [Alphaproteobacteria bacterium]
MSDFNNNQTLDSGAIPVRVVSGGGGGGTGVQDLLYTDDTGAQFVYRDNGATPPVFTAYLVPAGTAYTVGSNPRPYAVGGNVATTVADGANVTQGAKADAAATSDTGTFSLIALLKRLLTKTNPQAVPNIGQVVAGSTPTQLPSVALVNGATLIASTTNAGVIMCGYHGTLTNKNDGTGTGWQLNPGQPLPGLAITNLNQLDIMTANGNLSITDFICYAAN